MKYIALFWFVTVCNFGLVFADSEKASNTESPYILGGTFDSVSKYRAQYPSCLKEEFINLAVSSEEASLQFKQNQSRQSQHKTTTVEVSEDVLWGLWTDTYTYTTSTRSDNYTLTVGFTNDYILNVLLGGDATKPIEDRLIPEAKKVYDKFKDMPSEENYKAFRQMCGDKIITGDNAGVKLDFTLVFKFDSVTERDGALEIAGIDSFSKVIKMVHNDVKNKIVGITKEMSDTKTDYSLTAVAIQLGGNPNDLGKVFGKYGTFQQKGNVFSITCGKGIDCTKLINDVLNYSSKLEGQIQDADGEYDYRKLYYYNPTNFIDYSFYNKKLFTSALTKSITADSYKRKLGLQYFQDEKADLYASRYLIYLQNIQPKVKDASASAELKELIKKLKDIANEYKSVMALYKNPNLKIMDCSTNVIQNTCQSSYNSLIKLRHEKISEQSIDLVDYLMNSQYIGDFYLSDNQMEYISCNIMPISSFNDEIAKGKEGQFLADCSEWEDYPDKFIMKINRFGDKLMVNPFSYTIGSYTFSYSGYLAGNLPNGIPNSDMDEHFTDYLYEGTIDVTLSNNIKVPNKPKNPIKLDNDEFNLIKLIE